MKGKCELVEGCMVVAIQDGDYFDSDLSDVEAGMTFVYRGESPPGVHQFAPDFERGSNVGFQVPDDDMDEFFYDYFRVLAESK